MKAVVGIIYLLVSLSASVHAGGIGGALSQWDSAALEFHRPKNRKEARQYAQYFPKLKGLQEAKGIEAISEPFTVEMASSKKDRKSETLDGVVLEYYIDLLDQTEDLEDMHVYQILLKNSQEKVVHNEIVRGSWAFRIFNVDTPNGKDVVIRSLEYDPKEYDPEVRRKVKSRVRQLNAKVDRYEKVGMKGAETGSVSFRIVDAYNTVAIGKPKSGDQPWGLYRVTDKGPELIHELSDVIPGWEKGSWRVDDKPKKVSESILGAFATEKGSLVIVNDLKGILAINLSEGNRKERLFESPRDTFSVVLEVSETARNEQCQEFLLGIFRDDQGSYFYPWVKDDPDTVPEAQLTLGVAPKKNSGVDLKYGGCDKK